MFYEMRRKKQQLTDAACMELFGQCTSGVLAVLGENGYPYAVPLSYVCDGRHFYFHSATQGHKLDAVRACQKASFCVIAKDQVLPEKYTTVYSSAIAFGTIRILEKETEKREAIRKLASRYTPDDPFEKQEAEIERYWDSFCMLEFTIEHMTGKQAKELLAEGDS